MVMIKSILIFVHHGFCNWKNQFTLEIIGKKGYLIVDSLPKWGRQTISIGTRTYPSGLPKIKIKKIIFDKSWENEIKFLLENLHNSKKINEINNEGLKTLKIVKKLEKNV